jgi:hypothetical protein
MAVEAGAATAPTQLSLPGCPEICSGPEIFRWPPDPPGRIDQHASQPRDLEITRVVLQETMRTSVQHIWREEISPKVESNNVASVRHVTNTPPEIGAIQESGDTGPTAPLEAVSAVGNAPENDEPPPQTR